MEIPMLTRSVGRADMKVSERTSSFDYFIAGCNAANFLDQKLDRKIFNASVF